MHPAPTRMTLQEIEAFARDMEGGDLVTSVQVPDPAVPWRWFLPIAFMERSLAEQFFYGGYAVIYEYMSLATGWRVQNFPVFASCLFIHQEDFETALDIIIQRKKLCAES